MYEGGKARHILPLDTKPTIWYNRGVDKENAPAPKSDDAMEFLEHFYPPIKVVMRDGRILYVPIDKLDDTLRELPK